MDISKKLIANNQGRKNLTALNIEGQDVEGTRVLDASETKLTVVRECESGVELRTYSHFETPQKLEISFEAYLALRGTNA